MVVWGNGQEGGFICECGVKKRGEFFFSLSVCVLSGGVGEDTTSCMGYVYSGTVDSLTSLQ